jgi:short-subunit dehydrogenase
MKSFAQSVILITGASAGLGAEFARQLAPEAKTLILTARRSDRLEELKKELIAKYPKLEVYTPTFDLSQPAAVDELVLYLTKNVLKVDFLINNAGFGDIGTFETSDQNKIRDMIRVNIEALTTLSHALLPDMLAQKNGAILNIASTAAMLPLPTFAVYAASKAYVGSFSEALRMEVKDRGVTVTALYPGPVETEFGQVASRPSSSRAFAPPKSLLVSPEKVVSAALAGVLAGHARVIPGLLVKLGILPLEIVPMPIIRLIMASSAKMIGDKN